MDVFNSGPQPDSGAGEVAMVSLILIVCLAATPDVCREEQPPVDVASAMSCAMDGQLIALQWLDDHPKWTLRGWRGRSGRPESATGAACLDFPGRRRNLGGDGAQPKFSP